MVYKGISQYLNIWIELLSLLLWLAGLLQTSFIYGLIPGYAAVPALQDAPTGGAFTLLIIWPILYWQLPVLAYFKFGKEPLQTKKQFMLHMIMVWKIHWMKMSISILFTILIFFNYQQATTPEYNHDNPLMVSIMPGFMALLIFGLFYLNRYSRKIEANHGSTNEEGQNIINPPLPTNTNENALAHYLLNFMMMVFPFVVIFILFVFSVVQQ